MSPPGRPKGEYRSAEHEGTPVSIEPARLLPFSRWWPLLAGALAGLVLRLLFSGKPGSPYATMLGAALAEADALRTVGRAPDARRGRGAARTAGSRTWPDSFPPHALDDHVMLGGHYFDVDSTAYRLTRAFCFASTSGAAREAESACSP